MRIIRGAWSDETDAFRRKRHLGAEWRLSEYKRKEMTAGKAPQAILRVMHNSLSESDSEGTYSIILEPFALALAPAKCSANPSPSP